MAYTAEDAELFKHLQLTLASKNQKIAELQTQPLRLYDYSWKRDPAPSGLLRSADAVIGDDNVIYLRQGKSQPFVIQGYNVLKHEWLPSVQCSDDVYCRFSMVYHKEVTMIGGSRGDKTECGDEIFQVNPLRILSKMPTKRCRATALKYIHEDTHEVSLIVIGGENAPGELLKTVEILTFKEDEILTLTNPKLVWKQAQDIPGPLSCSSGTIVNGVIYLLGGWSKRDVATSSVFACSVNDLIATTDPNYNLGQVWDTTLPDLPVQEAACTSFKDHIMVVGGRAHTVAVRDIRTYNEVKKRWEVIGYLERPRYNCFAIGLKDKLIVIGGGIDKTSNENTMEIYQST